MLCGLRGDPQQPKILLDTIADKICLAFPQDSSQDVRRGVTKCVSLTILHTRPAHHSHEVHDNVSQRTVCTLDACPRLYTASDHSSAEPCWAPCSAESAAALCLVHEMWHAYCA